MGKSPFLMGKSTINYKWAMFNSFLYVYQRVNFGKTEKTCKYIIITINHPHIVDYFPIKTFI